ncbi:MAG: hypothetical protein ABIT16_06765 [Croceibacterium sp.]
MRAALISIDGQPQGAGGETGRMLAGKTLAQRQLAFALAAGAERIFLLSAGGSEAEALRKAAETAGCKVQPIAGGRGLLGAVSVADELLVLAPGLLPESAVAVDLLAKGNCVLSLAAGHGIAAGFERIDLERVWGGALVLPGSLVERLSELPPDIEPAAALLRIALQAKVPERRLPDDAVDNGTWAMVAAGDAAALQDDAWLARNLALPPRNRLTAWLALLGLRPLAVRLLGQARAKPALLAAVVVLLAGGIAATAYGLAPLGFVLAGVGALAAEFTARFSGLATAPFGKPGRFDWPAFTDFAVELVITVCAVLAIEQDWLHRLFPSLVLFGLLRALRPARWQGWAALYGDPLVVAGVLAIAAAFGGVEVAVMGLALLLIVLEAAKSPTPRG